MTTTQVLALTAAILMFFLAVVAVSTFDRWRKGRSFQENLVIGFKLGLMVFGGLIGATGFIMLFLYLVGLAFGAH